MAELADALRSGRSECKLVRVRVPPSAPNRDPVAQWIRALPCGGRGRAFESPQGHHRSEGRSRNLASGCPSERPTVWGGDRAVECARLENELGVKAYVGSNPTLPATRLNSVDSQFRDVNQLS